MSGRPVVDDTSLAVRVGRQLRRLRQERQLTLAALSARSGVSVSYLSAVETGVNHPSLQTLAAITEALGVRIPDVLAEERQAHVLRARIPDQPAVVTVSHPSLQLRSVLLVADAGDHGSCPVPLQDRDLFVYVVEGCVEVDVAGDHHTLAAGDALDATGPADVSWRATQRCVTSWTSCPTRVT